MIPAGSGPIEITKALLSLWESSRRNDSAPLHLLDATDFLAKHLASDHQRIVHGVRPSIEDFRDGCFMERPAGLQSVLSSISQHWAERAIKRRPAIPVFWITGPSG